MRAEAKYQDSSAVHPLFRVHPLALIGFVCLLIFVGLLLPLRLPIGPNYWDLSVYLDAAHRIANGQTPSIDFPTPAGPAEFYLTYVLTRLFPDAHPLLATQWSLALVAIPLFAFLALTVDKSSRAAALLLTAPFLLFAILPLNTNDGSTSPGFDGYGIYNRHPALLLYILTAAFIFVKDRTRLQVIMACVMLLLFLSKVTGFAAAILICLYALAARTIRFKDTFISACVAIGVLAGIELMTGMISAYLRNVIALAAINKGSFLPRFRELIATDIMILGSALLVAGLGAMATWRGKRDASVDQTSLTSGLQNFLRSGPAWLCAILVCAVTFEVQNTGSQDFLYVWPALLAILISNWNSDNRYRFAINLMIAVAALPSLVNIVHRTTRSALSPLSYQALDLPELGPFGRVYARNADLLKANAARQLYATHKDEYRELARKGINFNESITAERDFQILWLINAADAVREILAYERNTGRRLDTVYSLDFTDPFPMLLGRKPILNTQIGVDPIRTIQNDDPKTAAAIAQAQGVLVPQCPVTQPRETLARIFSSALEGRQRITLSPCWELYVRAGSDFASVSER